VGVLLRLHGTASRVHSLLLFLWGKREREGSEGAYDKGMEQVGNWEDDGVLFAALIHRRPGFRQLYTLFWRLTYRVSVLSSDDGGFQQIQAPVRDAWWCGDAPRPVHCP